jgi:hypothetical protein
VDSNLSLANNFNIRITIYIILQSLHFFGARTFWIHNTGPIGCLPVAMPIHNAKNNQTQVDGYLDQNGCVNFQNDLAKEFNKKLKDKVVKLREQFLDASLIYVDMFSAKYELISNANKSGMILFVTINLNNFN